MLKNTPISGSRDKNRMEQLQDWMAGCEEEDIDHLLNVLPRFDIEEEQIEKNNGTRQEKNNIYNSIKEIMNPIYFVNPIWR